MFASGIGIIAWLGLIIALSTAIVGVVTAVLAKARHHVIWSAFCVAVCTWSGCFFLIGQASVADAALFWWRISHVAVAFIPVLFLHFTAEYFGIHRPWIMSVLYIAATTFAYLSYSTDLVVAGVRWSFGEFYYDIAGPLYGPLIAMFAACCAAALALLYRGFRHAKHLRSCRSVSILFWVSAVGFGGGALSFAPVYGVDLYPIGIAAITIAPPLVSYAILRHQLLDIRISLERFFALALATVTLAGLVLSKTSVAPIIDGSAIIAAFAVALIVTRTMERRPTSRSASMCASNGGSNVVPANADG